MGLRSVRNADLSGKRVLTRVDFNVPLRDGAVVDDSRIRAALPTIAHMIQQEARVILCSHLGRPKGQVREELRLDPVAPVLLDLLRHHLAQSGGPSVLVIKCEDCIGEAAATCIERASRHDVVLLENLRFHPGETDNSPEFAARLAELGEIYVSDAFGTVHRAHASTVGVARLLPSYAGFLVSQEVEALSKVINDPQRPLVVVLGGAKISGKIEVLESLLPLADAVLVGGAMASTILKAQGLEVGRSLVEDDMLQTARELQDLARDHSTEFLLPVDCVVTDSVERPTRVSTVGKENVGSQDVIADIGEQTRLTFARAVSRGQTVFWNGPLGVFEVEEFSGGTMAIARAVAEIYDVAHTVVGGGESVTAVHKAGVGKRIHHVSTGGGASLEFVAGRRLPGLGVLEE